VDGGELPTLKARVLRRPRAVAVVVVCVGGFCGGDQGQRRRRAIGGRRITIDRAGIPYVSVIPPVVTADYYYLYRRVRFTTTPDDLSFIIVIARRHPFL